MLMDIGDGITAIIHPEGLRLLTADGRCIEMTVEGVEALKAFLASAADEM